VSSRGELEKVQAANLDEVDTGEVAEGLHDAVILVVDHKGTTTQNMATVAELSLTAAELARASRLLDIFVGTDRLQGGNGLLGLVERLGRVVNNARDLLDLSDGVSTGHHKGREGRSSQSRGDGVTLLVGVDLLVPLAPSLGRGEHATLAAHVSEGGLARTGVTATRHTGDTRHGATSSPGLSGVLVTGSDRDSVRLTLVLVHVGVNKVDNVGADRGQEDSGHDDRLAIGGTIGALADRNKRTSSGGHGC